jgi:hypothetical protein
MAVAVASFLIIDFSPLLFYDFPATLMATE